MPYLHLCGPPAGAFGPRLRAILSVLAGGYRLGKRPIRQLAFDLLGLTTSTGMISRLKRQGAAELAAPVEELRQYVRDAASAHIDETSWWQGQVVRVEGVEPTNNDAERALRHGVIYRKHSGGTDSEAGSRFVERILSVVATCRQQDINVLEYLSRCYQARLDGKAAPSLLPAPSVAQPA